jgi:ferritin-like protein
MTDGFRSKLLPRNAAALRRFQDPTAPPREIPGNPVMTRPESGIGNCFPGLECDLRNLERRFFPFLEIEIDFSVTRGVMRVASVDSADVESAADNGTLSGTAADDYRAIADDLRAGRSWVVFQIEGNFGPFGQQSFNPDDLTGQSLGAGRLPPEPWSAVRTLVEGGTVTLQLTRRPAPGQITLSGPRARYLDDTGALARMFEPGELTQSLCSPWTHDFRDCACFYWASNHPDIVLPPLPSPPPPDSDPRWELATSWLRADRNVATPPVAQQNGPQAVPEVRHHEINRDWQLLNFAVERRERLGSYAQSGLVAAPLSDRAALLAQLRYAAGVELAVVQEYLTAAYSLQPSQGKPEPLGGDLKAAFHELLRVAIGEMRHLRAVNDVIAALSPPGSFKPALAVATQVPDFTAGTFRPVQLRAATQAALDDFIAIEAPSQSVDGLYGRVLVTLQQMPGTADQQQAIRTVMAEGSDHWETFLFIKEWLGRHPEATYLRAANLQPPPPGNAAHQAMQQRYVSLLNTLYDGYQKGLPQGATEINDARSAMIGAGGMQGAMEAVASAEFLAVFDPIADPRFAAIPPPA